ncbi:hypothetical protein FF38_13219 [Lucilia cuprina]|uniref:Uncharacterized protein n=1 Tax=Lucilia cuprina TaxID=7375 RepID=A0A0L0CJR3_LUCCU|nr:hypothetical protein FF38_13219 [Lucilia cuprina]
MLQQLKIFEDIQTSIESLAAVAFRWKGSVLVLFILQTIGGQEVDKKHHTPDHIEDQQDQVTQQLPTAEKPNSNNQIQPTHEPSQVSVEIPAKVQQVVTQVSQHIPEVLTQQLANGNRVVRSLQNRRNWQSMDLKGLRKCDFICNAVDVTVCGFNGRCYREFESQCELSTYNCLNTQKAEKLCYSANLFCYSAE